MSNTRLNQANDTEYLNYIPKQNRINSIHCISFIEDGMLNQEMFESAFERALFIISNPNILVVKMWNERVN